MLNLWCLAHRDDLAKSNDDDFFLKCSLKKVN